MREPTLPPAVGLGRGLALRSMLVLRNAASWAWVFVSVYRGFEREGCFFAGVVGAEEGALDTIVEASKRWRMERTEREVASSTGGGGWRRPSPGSMRELCMR